MHALNGGVPHTLTEEIVIISLPCVSADSHRRHPNPGPEIDHLQLGFCLPLLVWLLLLLALSALASQASDMLTESLLLQPDAFSIALSARRP